MEHVCDEGCEKECVLITEAEESTIEVNGAWAMFVRSPVGGMVAGFLGNIILKVSQQRVKFHSCVEREDVESRARLPVVCEEECVHITEAEESAIKVKVKGAWAMFVRSPVGGMVAGFLGNIISK